jgi:hypothetical protein
VLPLDVLLFTMRWHFQAKRYDDASTWADKAAPYLHPRRAQTLNIRRIEDMSDDELAAAIIDEQDGVGAVIPREMPPGAGQTRH